jgi:hypothetical protein
LQAYPATVTRTQTDTSTPLTPAFLSSFDVIIFDQIQRAYSTEEASAMEAWVSQGGGVLSLTGFNNLPSDVAFPNSLLAPFGGQYLSQLLVPTGVATIGMFAASPVTTGIAALPFAGGYGVSVQGTWTAVAFLDPATPVAMISEHGKGRLYMWGDEWVEYSMEWGITDAQRFWQNGIDWLTHRR